MNRIDARLDRLETAAREQNQPEDDLSGKAALDRLYDQIFHGIPANFPPPDPETKRWLDALYDRIVKNQQERYSSRNGQP
jgi:hypothetical protein